MLGYHVGMDDTSIAAPVRSNLAEYTVAELSRALKRSIEENFAYVRVRGEISGFKRHGSGHCYLSLKDSEAVLDAVCWRTTAIRLGIKPEDGMEVVCTGRYSPRSLAASWKYQLIIDTIELCGDRRTSSNCSEDLISRQAWPARGCSRPSARRNRARFCRRVR